jgi:diguanylate cyclase (GGDEF)-like protein
MWVRIPNAVRPVLAWVGVLGMVTSVWFIQGGSSGFPAPLAAWPVLSAVLVVIAGTAFIGYRNATERRRLRGLVADKTRELRALATSDELTRIHNRRHVSELFQQQLAQHARSGEPLCVALLDIDRFKSINDQHGHGMGDQVLMRFAASARETLRATDLLGRWGGEEFLLVLPGTTLDCGLVALQRIRAALNATPFPDADVPLRVTYSAGLVLVNNGESMGDVVARADEAMYRAKAAGRDCVKLG